MKKNKIQIFSVLAIISFCVIILGISIGLTIKNARDLNGILEDSVKSQLISTSVAARETIDIDKFASYMSLDAMEEDSQAYMETLDDLRALQKQVKAEYIYAVKQINGKYYFIFDTDPENKSISDVFTEYDLSEVHKQAFLGQESAGIMNVDEEWGKFNTGAVPVFKDGTIIGIICTDIEDAYIAKSNLTSEINAIILIASLFATMCIMVFIVFLLLKNIWKMQDKLFKMANYDLITGLPNRQYLMNYLSDISSTAVKKESSFALLFIDLDNFKRVNDNAGHDAGDELLKHIATYLDSVHENSKSFRPTAGILNISARIGGDEFVQIVPGISNEDEAEMVAKRVLDNFKSQTLDRFIEKYQVGLSIGVALFPYHTNNFNVLIKYADIAMYRSKKNGKNTYFIYNDENVQKD